MQKLLLSWMMKQMPTEMLIQGLRKNLQSQCQMEPSFRGLATLEETCPAEREEVRRAYAAAKVAIDSVKFAVEQLYRCENKIGLTAESSEVIAPIELTDELLTYSQTNLQG